MRFYLRERTAAAHAEVDAAIGGFDSRAGYCSYLYGMLAFREPVEHLLSGAEFPARFGAWRPLAISSSIRADMADLELAAPDAMAAPAGLADKLNNPSALLGTLYVLQGASLGARVLVRRAASLGLSASFGARHLALQAEDNGWPQFLEILNREDIANAETAARASIAAFALARNAFVKAGNEAR